MSQWEQSISKIGRVDWCPLLVSTGGSITGRAVAAVGGGCRSSMPDLLDEIRSSSTLRPDWQRALEHSGVGLSSFYPGLRLRFWNMSEKVGALWAYLKELRRGTRPVDATRIAEFGLPTGTVLNSVSDEANVAAFLVALTRCLDRLPDSDKIVVRHYLFTKGNANKCAEAALEELAEEGISRSPSYYKNNLRPALERYSTVLSAELAPSQTAEPAIQALPWFEITEISWSLRLDEQDYRRQYWRRKIVIRGLTGDQPILTLAQSWSGSGHKEGDVRLLSGPEADEISHRCLRIRPESDLPNAWQLYIFDLGVPLHPGTPAILEYEETLYDENDRFQPVITQSTARYPTLERLEVHVDIPECFGVDTIDAYREGPVPGSGVGFKAVPPTTKITRDVDGIFHHCVTDIDYKSRYAVRWSAGYQRG